MPFLNDILRDLSQAVISMIAHPLRGQIAEVDPQWATTTSPLISVWATPSGASYPRLFQNVPWNVTADPHQSGFTPKPGDYVTLSFKGGSSEFPVVTAYYPGSGTTSSVQDAQSGRAAVPTGALVAGAIPGLGGNKVSEWKGVPIPGGYPDLNQYYGNPLTGGFAPYLTTVPLTLSTGRTVQVQCHRAAAPGLARAFAQASSERLVHTFDGSYVVRNVRGNSNPSLHSWGIAVDLNAGEYPLGSTRQQDPRLVQIMATENFLCGQNYRGRKDPMHFEFCTELF